MTTTSTLDEEYLAFIRRQPVDPRAFYARLHAEAPVYRTPIGYWFVSSYGAAQQLWRQDDRFSRRPVVGGTRNPLREGGGRVAAFFDEVVLGKDGMDHSRVRGVVDEAFGPRAVTGMRAAVERTVDDLLDAATAGPDREMDLVAQVARPLPTTVVLRLCGIDDTHFEQFTEVADLVIECFASTGAGHVADDLGQRAEKGFQKCADLISRLADERGDDAGEDLFGALLRRQRAAPDQFSRSELVTMMMFLVTAGFETTMHTVANGVFHLLRRRDQWEALCADPSLVASATQEILRYEPGVAVSSMMYATEDVDVEGVVIPRGAGVLISNHAANHDPARVPEPDRFDITRRSVGQLSFGRGRHTCLGAHLARLEIEVALERLTARLPGLRLGTEEPEWLSGHVLRGVESLHVTW